MAQHPEEGTLHAYIDGELSAAETAALELHIGKCALCAAALAEARGFVAAASRVITTLDAAPASAIPSETPAVTAASAPARRERPSPIFRVRYARAAALLLLVGGTAVVLDRVGSFARGKGPESESLITDAATRSDIAPGAGPAAPAVAAAAVAAATDPSTGAGGGTVGNVRRDAAASQRVTGGGETDGARRTRLAERSTLASEPAAAGFDQRGIAGGTAMKATAPVATQPAVFAGKDSAAAVPKAPALAAALPPSAGMTLREVVVTSAPASSPTVSRYRTRGGAIITLTEEPFQTSFAEESAATRQSAPQSAQRPAEAAVAARSINSYRWSSAERGRTYTLSGPLTVAELEALSKRLSELEQLP